MIYFRRFSAQFATSLNTIVIFHVTLVFLIRAYIISYFKNFALGKLEKNFGDDELKALILSTLKNIDFNYRIILACFNEKILFHLR